ncbi:MAG: tRNA uridine-5-carboxymethylaminomethyl(34) synthesis enzyme MnmG [Spirochaetales bacterium]|nr:tRNA uridine-5-carboxymethylaminomethyl(34) synthesis enzyme MnmG [Spirochaetales bacterium]
MDYDSIVVGAGHAGIEASLALARMGFKTLLITQNLDQIGKLSCNPAIGGLAKGNMVREIDALGGEMAKLIDASMIQFRILNQSRGPAVQAPRAQADRFLYQKLAKKAVETQPGLSVFQDTVTGLISSSDNKICQGVITERGNRITAKSVIISAGTFMEGKIFIGKYTALNGRLGELSAIGLGAHLRERGFTLGRMKTGTPARIKKTSIDFSKMEEQSGDATMYPFSFSYDEVKDRPYVPCYITYTNEETHRIIDANMHLSPLYGGDIVGKGPRYCPSIEDKVKKFPDRNRHQIFIEPEGLDTDEMYMNGISSSLPEHVQEEFIRTLPGLENVEIMRPGYAVEYDYVEPTTLYPTLESKIMSGLYFAGQTNGTSGYEEAGVQGLLAGINAGLKMKGEEPLILNRAESYAGVLIDDLVTLGTDEPYRMFTSRAEYRLNLRHDAADIRLFEKGQRAGLRTKEDVEKFKEKVKNIDAIKDLLKEGRVKKNILNDVIKENALGKTFYDLVKDPDVTIHNIKSVLPELAGYSDPLLDHVELDIKYEGYIVKQNQQVNRFMKMESVRIPLDFNYDAIEGISNESREKLKKIQPLSVGQASRISGVRTSDIAVLLLMLGKGGKK